MLLELGSFDVNIQSAKKFLQVKIPLAVLRYVIRSIKVMNKSFITLETVTCQGICRHSDGNVCGLLYTPTYDTCYGEVFYLKSSNDIPGPFFINMD